MKLLLEEMLNLMKISWPAILIRRLYLLQSASHIQRLCLLLFLFWFLLQIMTMRSPAHLPLDESFEPEPAPAPQLPRWVCSTQEAVGDLVSDPSDQRHTRS
jgi:hypothetical protein